MCNILYSIYTTWDTHIRNFRNRDGYIYLNTVFRFCLGLYIFLSIQISRESLGKIFRDYIQIAKYSN